MFNCHIVTQYNSKLTAMFNTSIVTLVVYVFFLTVQAAISVLATKTSAKWTKKQIIRNPLHATPNGTPSTMTRFLVLPVLKYWITSGLWKNSKMMTGVIPAPITPNWNTCIPPALDLRVADIATSVKGSDTSQAQSIWWGVGVSARAAGRRRDTPTTETSSGRRRSRWTPPSSQWRNTNNFSRDMFFADT